MSKKLEEMSLEELWELFPIFLVEHNSEWSRWYEKEEKNIRTLIPAECSITRISYIGTTAVPGIWAKNIVGILLEVPSDEVMEKVKTVLVEKGWMCMSQNQKRVSLNKGYTESGLQTKYFIFTSEFQGIMMSSVFETISMRIGKLLKNMKN